MTGFIQDRLKNMRKRLPLSGKRRIVKRKKDIDKLAHQVTIKLIDSLPSLLVEESESKVFVLRNLYKHYFLGQ